MLADSVEDFRLVDRVGRGNHKGDRTLAKVGIRTSDHGAFSHQRHLLDRRLKFLRINIDATGNDHVVQPVGQEEIPLVIKGADIAEGLVPLLVGPAGGFCCVVEIGKGGDLHRNRWSQAHRSYRVCQPHQ